MTLLAAREMAECLSKLTPETEYAVFRFAKYDFMVLTLFSAKKAGREIIDVWKGGTRKDGDQ